MSENDKPGDKTLSVNPTKTLSLKRPADGGGAGTVRQSFSHGRSNTVAVEVVRRRQGPAPGVPAQAQSVPPATGVKAAPLSVKPTGPRPAAGGMVLRTLSDSEQNARQNALLDATKREEDARRRSEDEARQRDARQNAEKAEREAAEARKREEDDRRARDEQLRRRGQDEAVRRLGEEPRPPRPPMGEQQRSGGSGGGAPRPMGERPPRLDGPRFGSGQPRGDRPQGDRPDRSGGGGGGGGSYAGGSSRQGAPGDRAPRPNSGGFGARPGGPRPGGPGGAPNTARFGFNRGAAAAPAEPLIQTPRRSAPGTGSPRGNMDRDGEADGVRRGRGAGAGAGVVKAERPTRGAGESKDRGRLTLSNALASGEERIRSVAAYRRRVQRMKGGQDQQKEKVYREVIIPETISIQELANRMSERGVDIIRMLMKQGQMRKITDVIDADTAQLIAEEMGHSAKRVAESDIEEGLFDEVEADEDLGPRAPVVTIMGHVDHGKTSLLDAIRKTNVVSGEAGGITQHIGAYQVTTSQGFEITFIDTPGHAAFTSMRARGARITDIVILVVAANDSVMPQTIEAINHAKAAGVPLIIAINKTDLPDAKPDRVKTDLLQHNVQVESMGGDTLEIELSAKTGKNLDKLLDAIILQAEVLDLKANPDRLAEGTIIEAKLDRGRGPVATVLVQKGTLIHGDIVVAGAEWGRVRAIITDKGEQADFAGPSMPVEVLGFVGAPEAGDRLAVVETEARAREIAEYRARLKREKQMARQSAGTRSLADMMTQLKDTAGKKELPLVIKGDVQGSVEAIAGALEKLGTDEVKARVVHSGVGGITESDVVLANSTGAVVIGFNVRAHKEARESSERAGVEIRYYNIIYDLVDDMKAAMSGLLAPTLRETMLGNARIQEVFNITKVGKVAGCIVTDGKVERGAGVRLIRDNVVIHEGTLKTLKRFKDEVKEVNVGQECGMAFEKYEDMRAGDVIECYRVEEVKRSL
jgi:translation initiation factor IF-2